MGRFLATLAFITLTCGAQEPPAPTGCVLKHIMPDDVWLSYATRGSEEVRFLGSDRDMVKSAKLCKKWLKEQHDAGRTKRPAH